MDSPSAVKFEKLSAYLGFDKIKGFTLAQAVCLWCGYAPPSRLTNHLHNNDWIPLPKWPIHSPIPDNQWPADVFALRRHFEETLMSYWRTIATYGRWDRSRAEIQRKEDEVNYYVMQKGKLYSEFLILFFRCARTQLLFHLKPKKGGAVNGLHDYEISTHFLDGNKQITEFDAYEATARLLYDYKIPREVLRDYALKDGGSIPPFLQSPKERSASLATASQTTTVPSRPEQAVDKVPAGDVGKKMAKKSPIPDFIDGAELQIKAKTKSLINARSKDVAMTSTQIFETHEMNALVASLRTELEPMLGLQGLKLNAKSRLNARKIHGWIKTEMQAAGVRLLNSRPPTKKKQK